MTVPVFLRTRHEYASYRDLWRFVTVSGFEVKYLDEAMWGDPSQLYITTPFTGEIEAHLRNHPRKARCVFWCLERPDAPGAPPMAQVVDQALRCVDAMWVSDKTVANLDPRLVFVPMGSHASFVSMPLRDWDHCVYDFAHISYAWGRRKELYAKIRAMGLVEAPDQDSHGGERDVALTRTRCMVNAQQHLPLRVVAPIRFAVAAAFGMPVVTETLGHADVYDDTLIQADISDIPLAVREVCKYKPIDGAVHPAGKHLHARLCAGDYRFDRTVYRGIEASF